MQAIPCMCPNFHDTTSIFLFTIGSTPVPQMQPWVVPVVVVFVVISCVVIIIIVRIIIMRKRQSSKYRVLWFSIMIMCTS